MRNPISHHLFVTFTFLYDKPNFCFNESKKEKDDDNDDEEARESVNIYIKNSTFLQFLNDYQS